MNFNTEPKPAPDVQQEKQPKMPHDGQAMNVVCSGILRKDGEKIIYVRFECADAYAEGSLPAAKITSHSGFSEEELAQLEEYLAENRFSIIEQARSVNVMKNFMEG